MPAEGVAPRILMHSILPSKAEPWEAHRTTVTRCVFVKLPASRRIM